MTEQPDFSERNIHPNFDDYINHKLGNYVYGLYEPGACLPFYIGKGGGKESKGNQRVLHHFSEARDLASQGTAEERRKITRIREVWARGQDVEWKILGYNLSSSDAALDAEAVLIATLNLIAPLTNVQGGHSGGLLAGPDDLYAWAAKPFDVASCPDTLHERPIFLFNIANAVAGGQPLDLATRAAWKVSDKWRTKPNGIALGLINGVARVAIQIDGWKKAEEHEDRWEIIGDVLPDEDGFMVSRDYAEILKLSLGFWKYGNYLVFEVTAGDPSGVKLLRGNALPKP